MSVGEGEVSSWLLAIINVIDQLLAVTFLSSLFHVMTKQEAVPSHLIYTSPHITSGLYTVNTNIAHTSPVHKPSVIRDR